MINALYLPCSSSTTAKPLLQGIEGRGFDLLVGGYVRSTVGEEVVDEESLRREIAGLAEQLEAHDARLWQRFADLGYENLDPED